MKDEKDKAVSLNRFVDEEGETLTIDSLLSRKKETSSHPKLPTSKKTRARPPDKSFIVPATDNRGHSAPIQARCNPSYVRRIDKVLRSNKFPYLTKSDVFRHALDRHLKWLEEIEPDLELDLKSIDLVNDMIREKQEQLKFTESLDTLQETVAGYERKGAWKDAREFIRKILKKVDEMEDEYLPRWFKQEVLKRFGYLLDRPE